MSSAYHEKFNYLLLRAPLGTVFLWFGIDKFYNPSYWSMWLPKALQSFLESLFQSSPLPWLIFAIGTFEVFVGADLILGFFARKTPAMASVFLALVIASTGLDPATVRDIGLLGLSLYLAFSSGRKSVVFPSLGRLRKGILLSALVAMVSGGPMLSNLGWTTVSIADPTLEGGEESSRLEDQNSQTMNDGGSKPLLQNGQALLALRKPKQGETISGGSVTVKLEILADLKKLGLSHIHLRVDGMVVDAIYAAHVGEMEREYKVGPGKHTMTAYLAYIDHTEVPGSHVTVKFTTEG